jgi:hypothetical protein
MWRSGGVHSVNRRGIRKPDAQQSLLQGAAIARRAERRRLAGLAQQGDGSGPGERRGDGRFGGEGVEAAQGAPVAWVGCQWLMEGYCGRAEEAAALPARTDARQQ